MLKECPKGPTSGLVACQIDNLNFDWLKLYHVVDKDPRSMNQSYGNISYHLSSVRFFDSEVDSTFVFELWGQIESI